MKSATFLNVLVSGMPLVSALCYDFGVPGPNAVCNVGPDSTDYLAMLEIVAEDTAGECQANDAPYGGEYFEKGVITYTGVDGQASTVSALNTISDVGPALTGTYTFSYPVPHTSIMAGSPITVRVIYSIPGFGDFASSTSVWTENHLPTILPTISTTTSTTPSQVITVTTSTITTTVTATVTPEEVTSTIVMGTKTIVAPEPTVETTITITPPARTVYSRSTITSTTTITCFSDFVRKLHERRAPLARDAAPVYAVPNCGSITTTTVYTSTSTVFEPSTTVITDTSYTTATETSTETLDAITEYASIYASITTTPPPFTRTIRTTAPRPTTKKIITIVVKKPVLPLGKRTPCCFKAKPPAPKPPITTHQCPFPKKK